MTFFSQGFADPILHICSYIPDVHTSENFALTDKTLFSVVTGENSSFWLRKCQQAGLVTNSKAIDCFEYLCQSPFTFKHIYLKRDAVFTLYAPIFEPITAWDLREPWTLLQGVNLPNGRAFFLKPEVLFQQLPMANYCYEFKLSLLELINNSERDSHLSAVDCTLPISSKNILAAISREDKQRIANPFYLQPKETLPFLTPPRIGTSSSSKCIIS